MIVLRYFVLCSLNVPCGFLVSSFSAGKSPTCTGLNRDQCSSRTFCGPAWPSGGCFNRKELPGKTIWFHQTKKNAFPKVFKINWFWYKNDEFKQKRGCPERFTTDHPVGPKNSWPRERLVEAKSSHAFRGSRFCLWCCGFFGLSSHPRSFRWVMKWSSCGSFLIPKKRLRAKSPFPRWVS